MQKKEAADQNSMRTHARLSPRMLPPRRTGDSPPSHSTSGCGSRRCVVQEEPGACPKASKGRGSVRRLSAQHDHPHGGQACVS
eukprot:3246142-Prymnesium_polylepis.2